MTNYIDTFYTFTGFKMMDAIREFIKILPARAYKAVGNNDRLTDISPAYLTEVATKVFGPVGIGWYYEHGPVEVTEGRTSKGNTNFTADINEFSLYYLYVNPEHAIVHTSFPIKATGSSTNGDRGHAVRGALTNALGAAFSKLCWQLKTYKGIVSHLNAAEAYKLQQEKEKAVTPEEEMNPAQAEETDIIHGADEPVNSGEIEEVEDVEEKVTEVVPVPAPEKTEDSKAGVDNITIKTAYQKVVMDGIGVPMAGSTLSDVSKSKEMGEKILTYLAGERPHAKTSTIFSPDTTEGKSLKKAAILVLADLREKGKIPKQRTKKVEETEE